MEDVGGLERDAPSINSMSPSPPSLEGKGEKSRVSLLDFIDTSLTQHVKCHKMSSQLIFVLACKILIAVC